MFLGYFDGNLSTKFSHHCPYGVSFPVTFNTKYIYIPFKEEGLLKTSIVRNKYSVMSVYALAGRWTLGWPEWVDTQPGVTDQRVSTFRLYLLPLHTTGGILWPRPQSTQGHGCQVSTSRMRMINCLPISISSFPPFRNAVARWNFLPRDGRAWFLFFSKCGIKIAHISQSPDSTQWWSSELKLSSADDSLSTTFCSQSPRLPVVAPSSDVI